MPEEQNFRITHQGPSDPNDKNSVNYIEWKQRCMTFGKATRNRRLWNRGYFHASLQNPLFVEQLRCGNGIPGECSHPYTSVKGQQLSLERIVTIDDTRTCLVLKDLVWVNENVLDGTFQTLDGGPGSLGDKLRRSIIQGIRPSVSVRAVVPQVLGKDKSSIVVGPGRVVCWDKVYYPADGTAWADTSVPYNITTKTAKGTDGYAAECSYSVMLNEFLPEAINKSEGLKRAIDYYQPAMESVGITRDGFATIKDDGGMAFVPLEDQLRAEFAYSMLKR